MAAGALAAALCLAAGAAQVSLPATHFTLRWQHSIEKIEWSEDYEVAGPWLHLSQARIEGSGAGMEPPPDAKLFGGRWHYRLADPWRREIVLARSEFVPDYELCIGEHRCRRMSRWIPVSAGATTLTACRVPGVDGDAASGSVSKAHPGVVHDQQSSPHG
ncbi:MAG: DUF1850 domain-containing protein [Gammaproteobacteria bacterium]|nr:DUF1850 domain-containing protein [Gammaproteobacteria bacterium]MBU1441912.1 DUF1850 domain-containing protein [Gammaproteobacteria bacterium]MBU2409163.1 DUF1850 domain-containing protein [Gammaproteobacteria bacterium]